MRRGAPDPQRGSGQADEVVVGDRLVVDDVVDGAVGGPLGRLDARAGYILDPDHVPPVPA